MALHDIAAGIQSGLSGKSFDGSLKFDCGEEGVIVLADGTIAEAWRKVKVKGHAQSVLETLETILNA